ncbi:MAG: lipoprotein [Aeromonadaceae bacterium]|nr:lipoprotein [Aeromonas sp.]MBP8220678.1 lipoprotein [Aeromonadaceae bacterium]
MLVWACAALLLTGCGLKGPLTMPKEEKKPVDAATQQPAPTATQPAKEQPVDAQP